MINKEIPTPETPLEHSITSDPEWIDGMLWGVPRPGHPEGSVGKHTIEVLANVDRFAASEAERQELRLIALLHDCRKHLVGGRGGTDHCLEARRYSERFLEDERLLQVIEHHDDVFRIYRRLMRDYPLRSRAADEMLGELLSCLREYDCLDLFIVFFRCDTLTGDKSLIPYEWLTAQLYTSGMGDAR